MIANQTYIFENKYTKPRLTDRGLPPDLPGVREAHVKVKGGISPQMQIIAKTRQAIVSTNKYRGLELIKHIFLKINTRNQG